MKTKYILTILFLVVHSALSAATNEPVVPIPLAGAVVETMDSGGYTYILVEHGGGKTWVASQQFKVAAGDKVGVPDGWMMKDFTSKTLNRKFDWILFAPAVEVNGQSRPARPPAPALPPSHPTLSNASMAAAANPHGGSASSSIQVKLGTIQKVRGGCTVEECHAQQANLAGKTVKVRGVVVKFTPSVLDRNWIHLRDGTGADASSDLTVTTTNLVQLGETIVVEGKLTRDHEFGPGIKYPLLLEDARISK